MNTLDASSGNDAKAALICSGPDPGFRSITSSLRKGQNTGTTARIRPDQALENNLKIIPIGLELMELWRFSISFSLLFSILTYSTEERFRKELLDQDEGMGSFVDPIKRLQTIQKSSKSDMNT